MDDEANKRVKKTIINRFETIIAVQKQMNDFAIKDIEIEIDSLKQDYEIITKGRLAFLSEQAAIARNLKIANNTISSQTFNTKTSLLTNLKIDTPFYLRGYKAIEQELYQIKNRKEKSAFIPDFYKLEKEKRSIEQDKTLKRAITLFKQTPLNKKDFKATIVKVGATQFETKNNRNLLYALALVFGVFIGVVYVLISKAFTNRIKFTVNP